MFNHPRYSPDLAPSDFHLFLHLLKFVCGQRQRFQNDRKAEVIETMAPIPGCRPLRYRIQKLVPRYDKCRNSGGEYVANSSTLAVSIPINLSIILGFVSVKGPRETYIVDALRRRERKNVNFIFTLRDAITSL